MKHYWIELFFFHHLENITLLSSGFFCFLLLLSFFFLRLAVFCFVLRVIGPICLYAFKIFSFFCSVFSSIMCLFFIWCFIYVSLFSLRYIVIPELEWCLLILVLENSQQLSFYILILIHLSLFSFWDSIANMWTHHFLLYSVFFHLSLLWSEYFILRYLPVF